MKLFSLQPASKWVEALPQGNGRLGTMVFGGVAQERVGLNEDTLWAGHPGDHIIPGAGEHIKRITRMILDGKNAEAEKALSQLGFSGLHGFRPLMDAKHVFTHLVWRMKGWHVRAQGVPEGGLIVNRTSIRQYAFPSALRTYHEIATDLLDSDCNS